VGDVVSTTFGFTGAQQTYVVPAGNSLITAELWGAAGSSAYASTSGWGGYLKVKLAVTPGETLYLYVGGCPTGNAGGFNGGGGTSAGYAGGGGATDIRRGGAAIANRVAVAGAAGGGGNTAHGGHGGGLVGAASGAGTAGGGTQSAGGASASGWAGDLGVGGDASANGAGGSGYWGGGGAAGGANDGGGGGSSWSSGTIVENTQGARSGSGQIVITLNQAPNAPTLTAPPNSSTFDRAATYRFDWTFSDPDAGDSQSAYDLRYRIGAGAWTTLSGTTPNSYRDIAGGTFAASAYEWQVRTYDAQGVVGPYSASWFFTAADATGVPTITAPTNGSTVNTSINVTWSTGTQTHYQVRKVADLAGAADPATVYYDSGEVTSSGTRSLALTFGVNARYEHLQVRVKAAGLWSAWGSVRVLVSWTAPMTPSVVCTPDPANARISIAVTNPAVTGGAPVTAYNDIYVSSPLDPEYRAATLLAPNSTWTWRTPAAGRAYSIHAVAIGTNQTTAASNPADTTVTNAPAEPEVILDGGTL